MPFPWKKVKSTKISRLVNDHLHISQKRRDGSSLVVETGFPTSLIDLFFKNREKLKKPSKKKRRNRPILSSYDVYDPSIIGSPISYPSPPPPSLVGSPISQRHSSILSPPPSCVDEICVAESSSGDDGGGSVDGGDAGRVLVRVLKVFVVVALALVTKRLTVGITISAAALLFLEYLGKHYSIFSPPVKTAAISIIRSGGGRLLRYKKPEQKQQPSINHTSTPEFHHQEIAGVDEIQPEKETERNPNSRNGLPYQEIELLEMAMKREESTRDAKSRKAQIKSKMHKIVPKKFRRSRKEQESAIAKEEEQTEQCDDDDIDDESENQIASSSSNEEVGTKIEHKVATEAALAHRYMPLCLIVLLGLIGGRSFAFVLTLLWFLLLKLGQKLVPRKIKLSLISC